MKGEELIEEVEEEQKWYKGPARIIIGIFLVLLILLMVVPYYGIRLDPEPKRMITISEINIDGLSVSNETYSLSEASKIVNKRDTELKYVANRIASAGCDSSKVCQAKAIYYFVRDGINYVADPVGVEYVEDPKEVLRSGAGDCESGSILLAKLAESIGVESQLVIIFGHAYVRVKLPEAINRHKIEDDWVYLDWTCKSCGFGEVPWRNLRKEERYIDV